MYIAVTLAMTALAQPAAAVDSEPRYAAFWLTRLEEKNSYPTLLVARGPFSEIVKWVSLFGKDEMPLFERWGMVIVTYKKKEIWNPDRRPIKPLTRFGFIDEKKKTLEANGVRYHYEECPIADVVEFLKGECSGEPISRIHRPLVGMQQTALALRLMLEAQLKADAAKK